MNWNAKKAMLAGMALIFALLLSKSVYASAIDFTLSQPNQTGAAGTTVDFFGIITNNDTSAVFLNNDNFTVTSPLVIDDTPFVSLPSSLGPSGSSNDSTGSVDIFNIFIPLSTTPGVYAGNFFQILGGATQNGSNDLLGTQDFTVNVTASSPTPTPEPGTLLLMASGLGSLVARRGWRRKQQGSPERRTLD